MKAPQPGSSLYCGASNHGESGPWEGRYAGRFVIFEADRRVIEEQATNLDHLVQEWRQKNHLPPLAGYCHRAEFPDCPGIDVVLWAVRRDFHVRKPCGIGSPPQRILCFVNLQDMREWKRQIISAGTSCSIHLRACETPDGTPLPNYVVLTCG